MEVFGGFFALVMIVLGITLMVLWIALPFIAMGINKRLDRIIKLLAKNQ